MSPRPVGAEADTDHTPVGVHATALAIGGAAALLRGPSGAGKSDLALRCLMLSPTALIPIPPRLIADDRVLVGRRGNGLIASAPPALSGLIEVRGVGLICVPDPVDSARIVLIVDLAPGAVAERLPDPWPTRDAEDVAAGLGPGPALPWLALDPREASAPIRLALALVACAAWAGGPV